MMIKKEVGWGQLREREDYVALTVALSTCEEKSGLNCVDDKVTSIIVNCVISEAWFTINPSISIHWTNQIKINQEIRDSSGLT